MKNREFPKWVSRLDPLVFLAKETYGKLWFEYRRRFYSRNDVFTHVQIQTTSVCNRACPYCPNHYMHRGKEFMDTDIFKTIINQLAEFKWIKEIHPHRYNEPLLDDRLPMLMSYARTKLPYVRIVIYTNGDFLTPERFHTLIQSGVDSFLVTQHQTYENGQYASRMPEAIIHLFQDSTIPIKEKRKIIYQEIKIGDRLSNRGGTVSLGDKVQLRKRCIKPNLILSIDYEGRVLLCCEQPSSNDGPVFGDLGRETIMDVWEKPFFKKVREDLRNGNLYLATCKKCGKGIWKG